MAAIFSGEVPLNTVQVCAPIPSLLHHASTVHTHEKEKGEKKVLSSIPHVTCSDVSLFSLDTASLG